MTKKILASTPDVTPDIIALRATAAGDVDEANAAIGAALCSGSMPHDFMEPLREIQNDLLDIVSDISELTASQPSRIDGRSTRQVEVAIQQYQSEIPPPEFAVLGGSSDAVGLLRLSRMVVRRASRSIKSLSQHDPNAGTHIGAYLEALTDFLFVLAFETELRESRDLPISGLAGGPSLRGSPHIIRRRLPG